jgi:hypothetical protein
MRQESFSQLRFWMGWRLLWPEGMVEARVWASWGRRTCSIRLAGAATGGSAGNRSLSFAP